MIAPGMSFGAGGRVNATIGATTQADFINEGVGFKTGGNLAIDTDAPAGLNFCGGLRLNASGAIYGTVTTDPSDVWVQGVRLTTQGQLVYASADAVSFENGNPITAAGLFAVN